jgi:hypothetical protein
MQLEVDSRVTGIEFYGYVILIGFYRPLGTFWRAARVGERLSPYVSLCCVAMAVSCSSTLLLLEKGEMLIWAWF